MPVRKIIYLINPISGTKNKAALPALVADRTTAAGIDFDILPTVANGNYQFLQQQITEQAITDVVICGGDGSVNTVVQQLLQLPVAFGIIPLGSGNGLALAAGIPKHPAKAIDVILQGRAAPIDAFSVNGAFACMLCGLGFDAQVAHDFAQQKTRGLLTYTRQSLKNFIAASPYSFTINSHGKHFTIDAFFISIANSNQFGNQVTIAPKASLNDGLLDVVVVPKMNKALLPIALLQQIGSGKPTTEQDIKKPGITYFQTAELTISNHSLAPLHIDGEPKETAAMINIRVLPACFRLLQPGIRKA